MCSVNGYFSHREKYLSKILEEGQEQPTRLAEPSKNENKLVMRDFFPNFLCIELNLFSIFRATPHTSGQTYKQTRTEL